jgi:hypothetical protein
VSAAAAARTLGDASLAVLAFDRELANWQGKIAAGAQKGTGLDTFRAALNWAKQDVPLDKGLLEKVKKEIRETAERHLADVYGVDVLDAIYFGVFPGDAASRNGELDSLALTMDAKDEIGATITRLASLNPVERAKEARTAAKYFGVPVSAIETAIKEARAGVADTKAQGRPLELPMVEPWPEPVNGAHLLDDIRDAVKRYIVLPDGSAEILALWTVHTHAFECFGHSPRLAITSAMTNGRCRMHGGTSPGAPVGNKNALKHGRYTADAVARRRSIAGLIRIARQLMG